MSLLLLLLFFVLFVVITVQKHQHHPDSQLITEPAGAWRAEAKRGLLSLIESAPS